MILAVIALSLLGFAMLAGALATLAATNDSSTGSFLLNATPAVSLVDFVDSVSAPTSTLTPDDTAIFAVAFRIDHAAGMTDILNATIYIYDDSTHGSDYDSAAADGVLLTTILWTEADDTWAIDQGSCTEWTMQTPVDPGTGSGSTQEDFEARFDISRAARADTSDWNTTVHVFDDDGTPEESIDTESALVTMSNNFEITFSSGTFSWGTLEPETTDNTHGALTLSVYANAQWELTIQGTDFTASAESDVDIEAQNIIKVDDDGSAGGSQQWIRNTQTIVTTPAAWDNQAPLSDDTSDITVTCYFLLDTGTFFNAGIGKTWSITVQVDIQANT